MTYRPQISNLQPARALLHPLWLTSLLVLAGNDHILKTAAFLPSALTGKLSDVAGLIVAPALFATVLCVRTGRGLALCHIAVAAVFTAIQLSASAANVWSAAMGGFGFPWLIVQDPTDLLTLPALGLSWRVLTPAMVHSAVSNVRRTAEVGAAGLGLVCCVATSPGPGPTEPFLEPGGPNRFVFADVFVHNRADTDFVVRLRVLRPDVLVNCNELGGNPGRVLADDLFQATGSWALGPGDSVAVWDHEPGLRPCYAALVDGDGIGPVLLFWRDGQPPPRELFGDTLDTAEGGVRLEVSPDGIGRLTSDTPNLVFARGDIALPPDEGTCREQSDADRVAFSAGFSPDEVRQVLAMDDGPDGCVAMDLATAAQVAAGAPGSVAYLCVPVDLIPVTVGDWVRVDVSDGLVVTATDEAGTETVPRRALVAGPAPALGQVSDLEVSLRPDYGCEYAVHDACGTVSRPGRLQALRPEFGGAIELAPGERGNLPGSDGSTLTIHALHALDRVVVDTTCALGRPGLGQDLELAVTYVGPTLP